uniref:Uncharacterized protein n=1 Tax=Parascaris equorum TaxID=6256 RepID=A0A914RMU0_PAREQ
MLHQILPHQVPRRKRATITKNRRHVQLLEVLTSRSFTETKK